MSGSAESESRHFTGIPRVGYVFFYALRTLVFRRFGAQMNAMRTAAGCGRGDADVYCPGEGVWPAVSSVASGMSCHCPSISPCSGRKFAL